MYEQMTTTELEALDEKQKYTKLIGVKRVSKISTLPNPFGQC